MCLLLVDVLKTRAPHYRRNIPLLFVLWNLFILLRDRQHYLTAFYFYSKKENFENQSHVAVPKKTIAQNSKEETCAVDWRAKKRCDLLVSHDLWIWSLPLQEKQRARERHSKYKGMIRMMMIKRRWTGFKQNVVQDTCSFYI